LCPFVVLISWSRPVLPLVKNVLILRIHGGASLFVAEDVVNELKRVLQLQTGKMLDLLERTIWKQALELRQKLQYRVAGWFE
jgi:hypothetical protein